MNGYVAVKNLEKYQHYKDRTPPWIKLHRDLLNDYEFSCLQDASKAHLMLIWLLASQLDNKIPNDPKWIAARIGCDKAVDLKPLLDNGFLVEIGNASKTLATCKQSAMPETETETETEGETETEAFARWWKVYPKKVGKKEALAQWKRTKPDADHLIADTLNRIANDDKWRNGYIKDPVRYLRHEQWEDEISAPRQQDLTEAEKYELRKQRNEEIIRQLDDTTLGHNVTALPSAVATDKR